MASAQPPKQRLTIVDVARRAGVAVSTVSRALSGDRGASAATRRRIQRIVRQSGYNPRFSAVSLRTGKTPMVGVLSFFEEGGWSQTECLWGLAEVCRERGLHLVLYSTLGRPGMDRRLESVLEQRLLGSLVVMGETAVSLKPLTQAMDWGLQVIALDADLPGAHCLTSDNAEGGRLAARRLASACRSFLTLPCRDMDSTGRERLSAFEQEIRIRMGTGLARKLLASGTYKEGFKAGRAANFQGPGLCGVFSPWGDVPALGFIEAQKRKGKKAGRDFKILGYNGLSFLDYMSPRLGTIQEPMRELGRAAGELLARIHRGEEVPRQTRTFPPRLIPGDTA